MADGGSTYQVPQGARVGVWDQWCVYSDRPYIQKIVVEGEEKEQVSLLNPETGAVILDNFAASKDDLPGNLGHNKTLTVAFYNAFVELIGGQITRFVTHDPRVQQPTVQQLPGGDDGSPPDDGLYWHRCRLTPLGMQAKPGMRKCSPEFFMNADDQHGQQVGPVAAGGAWTNYPFLEGCELNEFEKKGSPAMPKKSKFARMMEAAGIDEKDDDAVKMSKLRAYSAGEEAAEGRNAESEDDDPKKPAQMEGAAAAPADGKGKTEMEDPQVGTQAGQPAITEPPTDQRPAAGSRSMQGSAAQVQMERGALPAGMVAIPEAKLQTLLAAAEQLPQVTSRLTTMERTQQQATRTAAAERAVGAAWKAGQIIPRGEETHKAAQDRFMRLFEKGEAVFQDALAPVGSYVVPEAMMIEFERIGAAPSAPGMGPSRPDEALIALAEKRLEQEQKAGRKVSRLDAVRMVCMEREGAQLAEKYSNQPYRELGRRMGLAVGA